MSIDCPECAATRAAIGEAWFAGGVSAAEAVRRKTYSLEQYRIVVRDYDHRKTALGAITYTLRWLKGEITAQRALGQRVTRLAKRIERLRAAHSALSCEQGEERMRRLDAACDEPSEDPREVGYQAPVTPDRTRCPSGCGCDECVPPTCDDCGAVVGGNPSCDACCDWVREDAARRRTP